jgi:alpha-beta hydrolase superfamily lysophospholipase
MSQHPLELTAGDGALIRGHVWLPETEPRRVVLLVHGMAEHASRYGRFGAALADAGAAVFAPHLRGHDPGTEDTRGHFGDWRRLLADVAAVRAEAERRFPGRPLVLFGHSMGSFVVQNLLLEQPEGVAAAVLSATDKPPAALRLFGLAIASAERLRVGAQSASAILQFLSFGSFNRPFRPARTEFDWLSSDPGEVDAYVADPACGFACDTSSWQALLRTIGRVQSTAALRKLPATLPVLMVAGTADPVARHGAGPRALAQAYRRAGLRQVEVRLYPEGRHELLNDRIRDEVTADILAWLKEIS